MFSAVSRQRSIFVLLVLFNRVPYCAAKSMGAKLDCKTDVMKPSGFTPADVNHVRPADIKMLAAMGDSYMIGTLSRNKEDDMVNVFPGNSFVTGADEPLRKHITLANILKQFNPSLIGVSYGSGYHKTNFNVAVCRNQSVDLVWQAKELIRRINSKETGLLGKWKLIFMFVGTYDLGRLNCRDPITKKPIGRSTFKQNLIEALLILQRNLPRTIVSIIPMWSSNVFIGAQYQSKNAYKLTTEEKSCWSLQRWRKMREFLTSEYNKVAYEIQNDRIFEADDFAVVVQDFMDKITDVFRTDTGAYDEKMYASNHLHLSKYGNAMLAKLLWNSLLEPVGQKAKRLTSKSIRAMRLKCPTKESPYIRTLGNSF
ncbi:hypothetical protein Y032_0019g3915 [Ancylostoma ceylanicum]|uniref:SGNH hydrolase-type esterase domain-containing protein n=1 Tax=Ancylostoma ceylanicum TaxID=53326 RepID=A0A016V2X4_9BILA|nr:hypothetical protein Y032_0019g3915 [Ancylostoma ceylanicum]